MINEQVAYNKIKNEILPKDSEIYPKELTLKIGTMIDIGDSYMFEILDPYYEDGSVVLDGVYLMDKISGKIEREDGIKMMFDKRYRNGKIVDISKF